MTETTLALALYRGASSDLIEIEQYQVMSDEQRTEAQVNFEYGAISIRVDGEEKLGHRLSMGSIVYLVPQLEPARQRLSAGNIALIRSGVFDVEDANYLLLEASDDKKRVLASVISTNDEDIFGLIPSEEDGEQVYAYVETHKTRLFTQARGLPDHLVEFPLDYQAVVDGLERNSKIGLNLIQELGLDENFYG